MNTRRLSLASLLLVLLPLAAAADEPLEQTVEQLAAGIRKGGYKRVGVAPVFFQEKDPKDVGVSPRDPVSSHSLYFAEQVQLGLLRAAGDAFELVDPAILGRALHDKNVSSVQDLARLKELADQVGGLDALVVGTFQQREGFDERRERPSHDLKLLCRLLDVRSGALKELTTAERKVTLADAVYEGKSLEVMRWDRSGRLIPIDFGFVALKAPQLPLDPQTAAYHFDSPLVNPVLNPNCPYKLRVMVEGRERPLITHPRWEEVYVALEPGERFSIAVANQSPRAANVALFVDGLNVRDKRRQLPDENCLIWRLDAGGSGSFQGFYEKTETSEPTVSPFRVTPMEDSVAAEQRFTERLGAITLVVFNAGWPSQGQIARRANHKYQVWAEWNERRSAWDFREEWAEVYAAAPGVRFAIGADEARSTTLLRAQTERGPILAAFTIHYATRSQIDAKLREAAGNNGLRP